MVRLTPELIEDSFQYVNPVREYELNLRGYKIGLIENLGATLNQFDTIDFTDNDIRRIDGFPVLTKIKSLLFSNNKIQHIASNLELVLPHLENLTLTNNSIEELSEIDMLSTIKTLKTLSLLRNPVTSLKHYRLYTIYKIPSLRLLDFKKVLEKERQEANKLYKGKKLKTSAIDKPKTFIPGEPMDKITTSGSEPQQPQQRSGPTKEDIDCIRLAISQAKSIEEIEQLNAMLRAGTIPTHLKAQMTTTNPIHKPSMTIDNGQIVEEDEDDGRSMQ